MRSRQNYGLTFGGISLADFNCYYDGREMWRKPRRRVERFSVAGKNGDLLIDDESYDNIVRPFNCYINGNFPQNYTNLINELSEVEGYARFETTEEPDIFCMASLYSEIQPDLWQFNDKGTFTLEFDFKPQKWLKSGEMAIYVDDSISVFNMTSQNAKPLIEVTGTGSITINNSVLTLANNTSTVFIDCEMENAYEGTINRNPDLTIVGGFPVLVPNENAVSVSGCTINLIPRWWRL